jgi:hypothetical protein
MSPLASFQVGPPGVRAPSKGPVGGAAILNPVTVLGGELAVPCTRKPL